MFDTSFLDELRREELQLLLPYLGKGTTVLEFGAGTGAQARALQSMGFEVIALDLAGSSYSGCRVHPVVDYDGRHIPLPDRSVDIVFSSNVLEHIPHLVEIHAEFARVLRPGGYCVHVMPSVTWRWWTFLSGFANAVPASWRLTAGLAYRNRGRRLRGLAEDAKVLLSCVLPLGHGVSREGLSELWTFSAAAWRRNFARGGFRVDREEPLRIFHTGHMLFGHRWAIDSRKRATRWLGGAARIYFVTPAGTKLGSQQRLPASSV